MLEILNNRYVFLSKPISGRMSEVYKATDVFQDGKTAAVKLFKVDETGEINYILKESFRRESIELYDSSIDPIWGRCFLVMPWTMEDLENWLKKNEFLGGDDFYKKLGRLILQAPVWALIVFIIILC